VLYDFFASYCYTNQMNLFLDIESVLLLCSKKKTKKVFGCFVYVKPLSGVV